MFQKNQSLMEEFQYAELHRDIDNDGTTLIIEQDTRDLSDNPEALRAYRVTASDQKKVLTEYFFVLAHLPEISDKAAERRIAEVHKNHIVAMANDVRTHFKALKAAM